MKKILFFLAILLSVASYSQNRYIPFYSPIDVYDTIKLSGGAGGGLKFFNYNITSGFNVSTDTFTRLFSYRVGALDSLHLWRWTAATSTSRASVWSVQPASDGLGVIINENSQRAMTTFGVRNRFLGMYAGNTTLSGTDNYGFGYGALGGLTTASNCIGIGTSALSTNTTTSNQIMIGGSSNQRIYSYKNLIAIGTTNPATTFGGAYTLAGTTTGYGYAAITGLTDGTRVAYAWYSWDVTTGVTILGGVKASASNMWSGRNMTANDTLMIFYRTGVGLVITTGTNYSNTKYLTDNKSY